MGSKSEASELRRLRRAAGALARAQAERDDAVRAARAAGFSLGVCAEAGDLTKQGVRALMDRLERPVPVPAGNGS